MTLLELGEEWSRKLASKPESGMGYQRVSIGLKDGRSLHGLVLFNSHLLQLQAGLHIDVQDIKEIEVA